jgi:hypothetical protein
VHSLPTVLALVMIWTPAEVTEMRATHYWKTFEENLLRSSAVNQEEFVKDVMLREYSKMRGLEAHPYDLRIESMPGPMTGPPYIRVRVDWNPGQRPALMIGGPAHGHTFREVDPKDYPHLHTLGGSPHPLWVGPGMSPVTALLRSTYKFWGWDPDSRSWVYLYKGTN